MADVILEKPEAGAAQNIPGAQEGGAYALNFPQEEVATLEKDGDNLQIILRDGSTINIENYYATHNQENPPVFMVEGQPVAEQTFFENFDKADIISAAGGGASSPERGGRYNEYGNSDLNGGLDHLTRLDYNSNRAFEFETSEYVLYPDDGGYEPDSPIESLVTPVDHPVIPPVNHPVTIVPAHPETPGPDVPDFPFPGNPGEPGDSSGLNLPIDLPRSIVKVHEHDLKIGEPVTAHESLLITAPDGVGKIEVGGRIVWQDGNLVSESDRTFATDEGEILITGFNQATGELTYKFTLIRHTLEHAPVQGENAISHSLGVKAYDVDGDWAESAITVIVQDDVNVVTAHEPNHETNGTEMHTVLYFTASKTYDAYWDKKYTFLDSELKESQFDEMQTTAVGSQNGLKIIGTTVQYYYQDNKDGTWSIDDVRDRYGQASHSNQNDQTAMVNKEQETERGAQDQFKTVHGGRPTLVLSVDGLGLKEIQGVFDDFDGNSKKNFEIGTKNPETADGIVGKHIYAAEGIVIDTINHTANYGLNIEFGRFQDGDMALVIFYQTPIDSDDDRIVSIQKVTVNQLTEYKDGVGSVNLQVPDGFTKVIISALPGGNEFTERSNFSIRKVDFTRPAWEHSGTVDLDISVDGSQPLAWDISDLQDTLDGKIINIQNTSYAGKYKVEFTPSEDGNSFKVTLVEFNDGSVRTPLVGEALLEGNLNPETREWSIQQYYSFDVDGKVDFNIKFSATDYDGDTASDTVTVDMTLFDRFQNTLVGNNSFKDQTVTKGDTPSTDPIRTEEMPPVDTATAHDFDMAADYLAGENKADLIFGRGGSDLLIGDGGKDAYKDLNEAFGTKVEFTDIRNEDIKLSKTGNDKVDNQTPFETLQAAIKKLADKDSAKFEEALKLVEKLQSNRGEGGNDSIYGGLEEDIMFGAGGDDFLNGNGYNHRYPEYAATKDKDMMFGGAGNDIAVYDANDYIIHGGSGMDILLAGKNNTLTLNQLQDGETHEDRPYVNGFEMLLTALHTSHVENLGITSLKSLAGYGITINEDSKGVTLSDEWEHMDDTNDGNKIYEYNDNSVHLRLEVKGGLYLKNPKYSSAGKGAEVIGGSGNDVIFSHSLNAALEAGLLTVLGLAEGATTAEIAQAMRANPDAVLEYLNGQEGTYANVTGGGGDDLIFDNAANSFLNGDANYKSAIDAVLGRNSKTDKIDAFIDKLYKNDPAEKLNEIADKLDGNESSWESGTDGNDQIYGGAGGELMHGAGGDDLLNGMDGNDILIGGSGNDILLGGKGNDLLFGGSGNDYLDGGAGKDALFGGEGNDIIVYDAGDLLIDGGSGIDILLSSDQNVHLSDLLDNKDSNNGPLVKGVEVLIKGVDNLSLTNMEALGKELGFTIEGNQLNLDAAKWTEKSDGQTADGSHVFVNTDGVTIETCGMTLETSISETDQAVHQLSISNG